MPDYSFQDEAIENISRCYAENINSKQLLVIPTGGGKTLTALRAINKMLVNGVIPKGGVVYWIQHLKQLQRQSQRVLEENVAKGNFLGILEPCHEELLATVKIKMIDAASSEFPIEKPCLVIIDEAHHSAAASYGIFFQESNGVLGLTATPRRLDDNELEFDDIVYSITARELIARGVIVEPHIIPIKTNTRIDTYDLDSDGGQFDTGPRNMFVASQIFKNRERFKKGILFVRTREHAIRLTKVLQDYNERFDPQTQYEHIGYILGGDDNSLGITNDNYLHGFSSYRRALVVNCGVLTEGFDDPSVNTVFMVVPTKSIVLYLQCIGRAIRAKKEGQQERAFIVEFEDDMPNVRYRIDNKWLFADISDELEPEIIEKDYSSFSNLKVIFDELKDKFHLDLWSHTIAEESVEASESKSILLYNSTESLRAQSWKSIVLTPSNRRAYSRIFNVLSARREEYKEMNVNYVFDTKHRFDDPDSLLSHEHDRTDFIQALIRAGQERKDGEIVRRLKYIMFNKTSDIPEGLTEFLQDCFNRDEIVSSLDQKKNEKITQILKVPLILGGYEAVFLSDEASCFVQEYIENLIELKRKGEWQNWTLEILNQNNILGQVPISPRHFNALPTIVRLHLNEFMFRLY